MEQSTTMNGETFQNQLLSGATVDQSNNYGATMIIKQSQVGEEEDSNQAQLIQLLKIENQALKKDLNNARTSGKDLEFENAQLRHKSTQIDKLYKRIDSLQGTETEVTTLLKRQAELELQMIQ